MKADTKLYSEYVLREKSSGAIYSEKFYLNELSLKNIKKATDEEKGTSLYNWAKFFAAGTWEEINSQYRK